MINNVRIAALILALISMGACGIRLKGTRRIESTTIETFLVENGIMQYFVKPLHYRASNSSLDIDFTFRAAKDNAYKAKMNFTTSGGGTADSCKIVLKESGEAVFSASQFEIRKVSDGLRYFATVENKKVYDLFSNGKAFSIILYSKGVTQTYSPGKKAMKKIGRIPAVLLDE